ncbi:MAG: DUF998 domain-containing protein [Thermoproteota archaeon]
MNRGRMLAFLGVAGPLIAYLSIAVSIALTPEFSWLSNALSDLGHAKRSSVAVIFNGGLLLSGFTLVVYAVKPLALHAKRTAVALAFSALMLQAVAAFDEVYGFAHFVVSVLFFASSGAACLVYSLERRSLPAAVAFAVGLLAWILYWAGAYKVGIAVPETISAVAVTSIVVYSALRIMKGG